MRALTYYVAVSQDGFIAGPDGQIDAYDFGPELAGHIIEHLPETLPTGAREHLGIADRPNQRFDTVIMGRHTYGMGLAEGVTSPYGHLEQVVVSSTLPADIDPAVRIVPDDPLATVKELKAGDGLGIWLCGGGKLAGALLPEIDELVLKRQPILLGSGRPLIEAPYGLNRFELAERIDVGPVVIETFRRAG